MAVNTYNYKWYANDTSNAQATPLSDSYTINKATPIGSQSCDSWTVTYPTQTTVSCSLTTGDTGTTLSLKRDTVEKATGTSPSETITLGAGPYSYTCDYPATANYTATTLDTDTLTVNKGTLGGSVSGADVTYPTSINEIASETNIGDADVAYQLWRGDTLVSSNTGSAPAADTTLLGASVYSYKLNTTDITFGNWSSSASIATDSTTVNQNNTNPVNIFFINSTNAYQNQNITTNYGSTTANATLVYSNSGTANLYEDGVLVDNPRTTTLSLGLHNYTGNVTGNTNYTSNSTGVTFYMTIVVPACSVAIAQSDTLATGISFGNLDPNNAHDAPGNNGASATDYYLTVSITDCTPNSVNVYAKASGDMISGSYAISVSNQKFRNSTSDNTVPTTLQNISLTTNYADNKIGSLLTDGNYIYLKYNLDVPASQAAASDYQNTVYFWAGRSDQTPS
jgi:hypothetical protein